MNLCVAYFFDPAYFAVFVLVISQKVRFSKKKVRDLICVF